MPLLEGGEDARCQERSQRREDADHQVAREFLPLGTHQVVELVCVLQDRPGANE
jgi:hypothetical protein